MHSELPNSPVILSLTEQTEIYIFACIYKTFNLKSNIEIQRYWSKKQQVWTRCQELWSAELDFEPTLCALISIPFDHKVTFKIKRFIFSIVKRLHCLHSFFLLNNGQFKLHLWDVNIIFLSWNEKNICFNLPWIKMIIF